jgi:organic hydroperoxide reductase OsmC/OhrA
MEPLYTARATAHGGRQGYVDSSAGVLDLDLSTPEAMGGQQKKNVRGASVTAVVGLEVEPIGTFPNLPPEEAEDLMREAHQICPYAKATRGNIVLSVAE